MHTGAPGAGDTVIDIGCGSGETTLALSSLVGSGGRVLGVDVSEVMLSLARERARDEQLTNVDFLLADAQTHGFESAACDLVLSRFGVMFFNSPVLAFKNISKALRKNGRIVFVTWAELENNPWFKIPGQAAVARLGRPAPVDPRAPGPFAFAEKKYVEGILQSANLGDITIEEKELTLVVDGSASDAADLACNLGPAVRLMKEKSGTAEDFEAIRHSVASSLERWCLANTVEVPCTVRFYSCRPEEDS